MSRELLGILHHVSGKLPEKGRAEAAGYSIPPYLGT